MNFSCSLNIPLHLHQVTLWVSLTHKRAVSQGSVMCHTDVINHTKQITSSNNYPVPARASVTPVPAASSRAFPPTQGRVFKADHRILREMGLVKVILMPHPQTVSVLGKNDFCPEKTKQALPSFQAQAGQPSCKAPETILIFTCAHGALMKSWHSFVRGG